MGQRMLFMHIDRFLNKEAGEHAICARFEALEDSDEKDCI